MGQHSRPLWSAGVGGATTERPSDGSAGAHRAGKAALVPVLRFGDLISTRGLCKGFCCLSIPLSSWNLFSTEKYIRDGLYTSKHWYVSQENSPYLKKSNSLTLLWVIEETGLAGGYLEIPFKGQVYETSFALKLDNRHL